MKINGITLNDLKWPPDTIYLCPHCMNEVVKSAIKCRKCNAKLVNKDVVERSSLMVRDMPDEIKGLNFGGFFLGVFWAGKHNIRLFWLILFIQCAIAFLKGLTYHVSPDSFLLLISTYVVPLLFCSLVPIYIYLLLKGNALAWRNRYFKDVKQFRETQRVWGIVGFIVFCAEVVIWVLKATGVITIW